jgi:PAS domain S-box-containing protein
VLIPLGVRFFLEGTPRYMVMGALTLVFLAVLLNVARLIHDPIVSSIRLRLENADLVTALTAKASDLTRINQLLRAELGGKTEAMDQLGSQVFFLQEMMDAIPNPIYYKSTQGVYQGCNKALESLLGRSKSGIVGKTVFDIVPAELAEYHHQKDLELLRQGGAQIFETKLKAADGSFRHVLFCKALYHNPLGAVTGIIGVILDITERKRAEEELKLFRTLLDHAKDSIEVIDPHTGRFLDGNEMAWASLGYTRSELLSLTVPDIDPMVTAPAFAQYMQRLRDTKEPIVLESVHRRKDGTTFPVEVSAQLIRQDREYLIAIVRNITDRKQAEQALRL